jgi:hypothetical protein
MRRKGQNEKAITRSKSNSESQYWTRIPNFPENEAINGIEETKSLRISLHLHRNGADKISAIIASTRHNH